MYLTNWKKRLSSRLAAPLLRFLMAMIWSTCRVERVLGEDHLEALARAKQPFIPCYWHQMHIFCTYYVRRLLRRGHNMGFLISPSRDGEIGARVARAWGARVIRGSSSRTGAQAVREIYQAVAKEGVCPVFTADGPRGPIHVFKPGAVMISQLTKAPMLPMAYAASRAWQLRSWDRLLIPKPFARIVIAIGAPQQAPAGSGLGGKSMEALEPVRQAMEHSLNDLTAQAQAALARDA